jgi:formate/nitrite transporter FocA (FNT family)
MAMFAAVAMLLGAAMSWEGHTSLGLTNFCGALFFVFAYHNPDILLVPHRSQTEVAIRDVAQKKFLWTSLAVGIVAIFWEFKDHLPLG